MRLYLYNVGLACTGRAQTMELQSFFGAPAGTAGCNGCTVIIFIIPPTGKYCVYRLGIGDGAWPCLDRYGTPDGTAGHNGCTDTRRPRTDCIRCNVALTRINMRYHSAAANIVTNESSCIAGPRTAPAVESHAPWPIPLFVATPSQYATETGRLFWENKLAKLTNSLTWRCMPYGLLFSSPEMRGSCAELLM